MENLLPEQIEEYKQIDTRIIFLIGQANRYMSGYLAAFIGFWIWMANRKTPMEILSASMILSMILFLGVVLLDIHGRSISKTRAYKIVFFEQNSRYIHHESSMLKIMDKWTIDRLRSYGLLGVLINLWGIFLLFVDPANSFVKSGNKDLFISSMFFIPGIIYSCTIFLRKNRLLKYTQQWNDYKKTLDDEK